MTAATSKRRRRVVTWKNLLVCVRDSDAACSSATESRRPSLQRYGMILVNFLVVNHFLDSTAPHHSQIETLYWRSCPLQGGSQVGNSNKMRSLRTFVRPEEPEGKRFVPYLDLPYTERKWCVLVNRIQALHHTILQLLSPRQVLRRARLCDIWDWCLIHRLRRQESGATDRLEETSARIFGHDSSGSSKKGHGLSKFPSYLGSDRNWF